MPRHYSFTHWVTAITTQQHKCTFVSTSLPPFDPPPSMPTVLGPPPPSLSVCASLPGRPQSRKQQQTRAWGDFNHFAQVVRKDVEFLKRGIDNGVAWANHTFRIPQVAKKIDDVVWLRHLEDPRSPPFPSPSWPQPWYPGLRPHP